LFFIVGENSRKGNPGIAAAQKIRTTVRYTHVGYEQTRETAEALSKALE
jgi:hypothetical protein